MVEVTLEHVFDELQRGKVYECSLRSKRWQLDGLQDGDAVYLDPRPAILDTLVHELLHRLKPRWGEMKVRRETRRLIGSMDEGVKQRWWRAYQRIKRVARPVDVDDE